MKVDPRRSVALWLSCMFTAVAMLMPAQGRAQDGNGKYALLVGCTIYPNLEEKFHLVGPANDVVLGKEMLVKRFGFPEENVVVLADIVGSDDHMPTKANIEREWKALAEKASKGDQVFVLMAGHGTQAPMKEDDDSEADGLDEMFLPRDVGPWDDTVGEVQNGIKDDDIKAWIAAIRAKGANLWVIVDACHSGTMTRDLGDEVKRELRPDALGIPQAVMDAAKTTAPPGAKKKGESQLFDKAQTRALGPDDEDEPVLVALYAAQSVEPTVEKRLPRRGDDRKYYGLLTYTMNQVMAQSESKMTYRELVQKIHKQYVTWGRVSPTPVLEGNGIDREVLGLEEFPDRPSILIGGSRLRGYKIDAGALSGLTKGSILAVYPEAGAADADDPIGHVRILDEEFEPISAKIEPIEYAGLEAPSLKSGQRCKAVYVDFGDQRLRLSVDARTDIDEELPTTMHAGILARVKTWLADHKNLVAVVDDPKEADWLLQLNSFAEKQLFLTPVSGWAGEQEGSLPPLFGPAPKGEEFQEWFVNSLTRIARVQSLLGVSGGASSEWDNDPSLEVELRLFKGRRDRVGEVLRFDQGGIKLYNGDRIGFRVKNASEGPMDVTMLLIDSGFGISPLYPAEGQVNRLYPGNQVVRSGEIGTSTIGLEHLLVVGVKAKPVDEPTNFSFLAQPTIERSRALGGKGLGSPLGKIFQNSLFGEGGTRGASSSDVASFIMKTMSWQTMPETRPEE